LSPPPASPEPAAIASAPAAAAVVLSPDETALVEDTVSGCWFGREEVEEERAVAQIARLADDLAGRRLTRAEALHRIASIERSLDKAWVDAHAGSGDPAPLSSPSAGAGATHGGIRERLRDLKNLLAQHGSRGDKYAARLRAFGRRA